LQAGWRGKILERLLESNFILVLLFLHSQLDLQSLLELLLDSTCPSID
jgi:hypothetical protein